MAFAFQKIKSQSRSQSPNVLTDLLLLFHLFMYVSIAAAFLLLSFHHISVNFCKYFLMFSMCIRNEYIVLNSVVWSIGAVLISFEIWMHRKVTTIGFNLWFEHFLLLWKLINSIMEIPTTYLAPVDPGSLQFLFIAKDDK